MLFLELKSSINYQNGASLPSGEWGLTAVVRKESHVTPAQRVTGFHLSKTGDFELGDGYLNAGLLLPLEELKSIDLSEKLIRGLIQC